MRKLRLGKIQPLWPEPLSSDPQTVWFQSLCFFLPHQSVLKREQVFWWKQAWIYPSAFRAHGSIPGDKHSGKWKHSRHTRFPNCLLCSRANFVLHALVSGHPHFVWPWLSLPQQSETLGPSWYPRTDKSRDGRRLLTCLCEQYSCWTYFPVNIHLILKLSERSWKVWTRHCFLLFRNMFPGFIYLSHFPGGIFYGRQRMNRLL